jgi:hypothetical protein
MNEDRVKRLAARMDRLAEQDELLVARTKRVESARRIGAAQIYQLCAHLVRELNTIVTRFRIEIAPDTWTTEAFRESGVNIVQINANGRLIQVAFQATDKLVSSENYVSPYIIEGAVRWFNQELLDGRGIEEEQLFLCWDDKSGSRWRWQDPKTRRSGAFDLDHLMGLLERL